MECGKVRLKLDEYLKGRLDRSCSDIIREHLEHCHGCMEELNILKEINEILSMERPALPGSSFTADIMNMVEKEIKHKKNFVMGRLPIINLGASLLMAGLLTIFINTSLGNDLINNFTGTMQYGSAIISSNVSTTTDSFHTYINKVLTLKIN